MSLDEFPVGRKLFNNYLKYLEMDSSTYSRWRNIYSRKSKIQHKQDLHTTSYHLTQQAEIPFQTGAGLFLPLVTI